MTRYLVSYFYTSLRGIGRSLFSGIHSSLRRGSYPPSFPHRSLSHLSPFLSIQLQVPQDHLDLSPRRRKLSRFGLSVPFPMGRRLEIDGRDHPTFFELGRAVENKLKRQRFPSFLRLSSDRYLLSCSTSTHSFFPYPLTPFSTTLLPSHEVRRHRRPLLPGPRRCRSQPALCHFQASSYSFELYVRS